MSDYNIDDILSEVKKRREENEKRIKENAEGGRLDVQPVRDDLSAPQTDALPAQDSDPIPPQEEISLDEIKPETPAVKEVEEEGMLNLLDFAEEESAENDEPEDISVGNSTPDVLPVKSGNHGAPQKKNSAKRSKTLKALIIALIVLIIAAAAAAIVIVNGWINDILDNDDSTVQVTESEWEGMKTLVESFDPIYETEADQIASMEDMVKTWYYNGAPCSSSHVLNVMLIGEDTREEEITEEDTRADAAILASINIDTQEIMLTSILRDSWSYYETEPGNEESGRFSKLNEALSYGGLSTYLNAVEHLYKVKIDGYAIVNFDSFETIIDTLYPNGITLELTAKEINEINNHPGRYGDVYIEKTFEGTSGEMALTGEQALAYCRIRHIDSDGARADRQKTTLMKIYEDMRDAGNTKLLSLINELTPYVKTSFNKSDIIKIGKYALSQGWTKFDIDTQNFPEYRVTGGRYQEYNNLWIWKSDFPADAYYMQTRIYNKSSITLASVRVDTQKVRRSGFFSKGDSATTATLRNEHYGEVTSVPSQNKEEEEE